MAGQYGYGRVW